MAQKNTDFIPAEYAEWLAELKTLIRTSRVKASLAVNRELIQLYWRIGNEILARQRQQGWGAKIIDHLAQDLRHEFPDMKGLSPRTMKYMRAFAEAWPDESFVQQAAAQIPWFHNCVVMDKVKDRQTREWYIKQTIENGWSRSVLEYQIETQLHARIGMAQHNFERSLPAPQSELARDIVKDHHPINFKSAETARGCGVRGCSSQNLWRMRQFSEAYQGEPKRSPLVRVLLWTVTISVQATNLRWGRQLLRFPRIDDCDASGLIGRRVA